MSAAPAPPTVYVDADACPVKDETYRVAGRHGLKVVLVANSWMNVPREDWIRLEVVGQEMDAADDWIAEAVRPGDVVITNDVPLASRTIEKQAYAVRPTGKEFSEDNIGDVLATRDLLTDLRSAGERTGGPAPITKRDRSQFLQRLEEAVQKSLRSRA